jgi:hypothetical protein
MRFSFRALLVLLVSVAIFLLLLRTGSTGDSLVGWATLAVIAAMSVVALVLTITRGGTYGQDAAVPRWLRRWLLDEPRKDESDRRD